MSQHCRRCHLLVLLLLASAILVRWASAAPLTTLTEGNTGTIAFESLTLPEWQMLPLSKDGNPVVITGELTLPQEGTGRVPAVILVHGAGGVTPNLAVWAGELQRLGLASFILDSLSGRGIREIRTGRARLTLGSRLIDAYRALELLATHPRLDPARIALMGFSHGGGVVLRARHRRFQRLWLSGDREFVAYLAFYPGTCNMRLLDEAQVSDRPLRLFHGTADDQTIIAPCRDYVERVRQAGKDVVLFEYPDAHHAFDIRGLPPARFDPEVITGRGCTFIERVEGHLTVLHRDTDQPASFRAPCRSRGITVGYHPQARQQAIQDVRAFLSAALKTGQ